MNKHRTEQSKQFYLQLKARLKVNIAFKALEMLLNCRTLKQRLYYSRFTSYCGEKNANQYGVLFIYGDVLAVIGQGTFFTEYSSSQSC